MSYERNEEYYASVKEEAKKLALSKPEDLAYLLVLAQRQLAEVINILPLPKLAA